MAVENCVLCEGGEDETIRMVNFPGAGEKCLKCNSPGWDPSDAKLKTDLEFRVEPGYSNEALIATKKGRDVGELRYTLIKDRNRIDIQSLKVEEAARGQGVATELVRELFVRRNPGVDGEMRIWLGEDHLRQKAIFEGESK